jgi:predicted transposase YbfD/YdcC
MTDNLPQHAYSNLFIVHFESLEDRRRVLKGNYLYPLTEVLFLVVTAVLCGYTDNACMSDFGRMNLAWLRKYFPYQHGICSPDVIGKLFQRIDYGCFCSCFSQWAKECFKLTEFELVSIDGKRLRGSYDASSNKMADHIVSAYLSSSNIVMGQVATDAKSNEITAIPQLLDSIDIKGCIISIDAMGCQKKIAQKIIDKGAGYLLAVKDNQEELHQQVQRQFELRLPTITSTTKEVNGGRVEIRTATLLTDLSRLNQKEEWAGLNSILKIDTERYVKATAEKTNETRYYISSCSKQDAATMNSLARGHWGIENKLHWHLDVTFGEDKSRKRVGNAAKNFNIILKTALILLQRDKENKISVKRKRLKAAHNIGYRESIMKI